MCLYGDFKTMESLCGWKSVVRSGIVKAVSFSSHSQTKVLIIFNACMENDVSIDTFISFDDFHRAKPCL